MKMLEPLRWVMNELRMRRKKGNYDYKMELMPVGSSDKVEMGKMAHSNSQERKGDDEARE